MKKLILINGTMGVGKTSVSKRLLKKIENSFWLDGDNCWRMNPFIVDEENKKMVISNIKYILNSYLENSKSEYVIFNWVMDEEEIIEEILSGIENRKNIKILKITLVCGKKILIERITKDIKLGKRTERNIEKSINKLEKYRSLDTIKIDTSLDTIEMTVEKVVEVIQKSEKKNCRN